MRQFQHEGLYISLQDNGKWFLNPTNCDKADSRLFPERPNFRVEFEGEGDLWLKENELQFTKIVELQDGLELHYRCNSKTVEVIEELRFVEGAAVVQQQIRVKNFGNEPLLLTRLSSLFLEGIAGSSSEPWYQNEQLRFWICHNKWQGEGQWQQYNARQLGLYPTTNHTPERASWRINSIGSWTTANFYPLVLLEDPEREQIWYAEIQDANSWSIKWTAFGGRSSPSLCLDISGCDEKNGWSVFLRPKEEYASPKVIYGVISGTVEGAVKQLYTFKRKDSLVPPLSYVIFNDYLNGLWVDQRPEKICPLIKAAAKAGCDVFCLDDGWEENEKTGVYGLGDWIPNKSLYCETSLKEIVELIRAEGMIPGIWLELETCDESAKIANHVLKRHENPIGRNRRFINMKDPEAQSYLIQRIEKLYEIGFRYIKNDYNHSLGIGCLNNLENDAYPSPAEGIRQNHQAFLQFMDHIRRIFPDLIIENCGSGALRCDYGTLRHFSLQSVSDQELYTEMPSIVMGMMMQIPPERLAIWATPYPTSYENFRDFQVEDGWLKTMEDGCQTVFNMVTGLMGTMMLSGRIDLCDEKNFDLVKEAVQLSHRLRPQIEKSFPVWPTGFIPLNEKGIASLGLLSEQGLLLAVWNLKEGPETVTIDLSKWIGLQAKIDCIYPQKEEDFLKLENRKLKVCFKTGKTAFFLKIDQFQ